MGQDSSQTGQADYYLAQVSSASLYYPFGWEMPGRKFVSGEGYRFGFNGQEEDPDMGVVFKYRIHNARVGRFLSVDPLAPEYPWNSCYAFAENRVIEGIDLEGLESSRTTDKQFTAPADPKLGVPAVDGISYNVPNLQVDFELKEAQRESAQKSLYNSNKAYVGPFTAEMKRRMALQREAKQQLEASQNPIILLGQFSADGFWTVYDAGSAGYHYYEGNYSKGTTHLLGAIIPFVPGRALNRPINVSLGIRVEGDLRAFSEIVDAPHWERWKQGTEYFRTSNSYESFENMVTEVMSNVVATKGTIKFQLDGFDFSKYWTDGGHKTGVWDNMTNFELSTILSTPEFLKHTEFYKNLDVKNTSDIVREINNAKPK
ncbi:hypothetical protein PPO43_00560 [Saprospira sp. CCB-QB6]|uniref:RHS repeat domain-containing protein n=1 Tax=Saprospira sp. CCB-QB6 TaxID=3023936 RepID=UPI00234A81C6|nr:RHS repeat-associated core domain-containing protein [Saprospira sp. CCB-QB6]WCL81586.1 hypothetical protein PPO43_00560 [Saprospira sp. CCB-QB6]